MVTMAAPREPERVMFSHSGVRVGTFRCPVQHPEFRTAGPIEGYTIAFPRSAVWIQPEGHRPFVADPGVVTIYNLGQRYVRLPLSEEGDRCDWFSVSRETAHAIASGLAPDADPARPFPVSFARTTGAAYYRQRRLFARIVGGRIDPFEVEQEVSLLLGAVLEAALVDRPRPAVTRARTDRDVAEYARAELARNPLDRPTVRDVATRVGVSPFYLCRVFRRYTGVTLHHYLLELRMRLALERFGTRDSSLSRLALELGFSSHSHFTAAFRTRLGFPPSRARKELWGVLGYKQRYSAPGDSR
jgi:AraC family transcriptional regulator